MTTHLTRPPGRRPPTRPTRRSCCCAPSSPSRPIVFGLDKFANVLTDWPQYLAPWIDRIVPGTAQQAMYAVGVVEVRGRRPGRGAPRGSAPGVVAAWLAGIIVNLLTIPGFYDIALRDFGLLVGAVALARLAVRDAPGRRDRPDGRERSPTRSRLRRPARPAPRGAQPAAVDLPAAEQAVADLLRALGRDPDEPHLADTPRRVADAYAELLTPPPFDLTTFPNDEGYNELVLATAHPGAVAVRAPPAAVHRGRAHRLPARRADPRPVEARPGARPVRPRPAGAGAAHPAGRRLAAGAT